MKKINKINCELNSKSPNLIDNIKQNVNWQEIKENNLKSKSNKKRFCFNFKIAFSCICLLVIICLGIGLPFIFKNNTSNNLMDYVVFINVNPNIKLNINSNDVVTKQIGLNEDGVILLYSQNLVGKNVNEATQTVLKYMLDVGLIKNRIKFSVVDNNGRNLENKQNNILNIIQNSFINNNFEALILTEDEMDKIEDYYEQHNISEYDKNFINLFKDKLVKFANKKIDDINNLILALNEYNINNDNVILDFNKKLEILLFGHTYKYEIDLDFEEITYEDIYNFCLDLVEYKEDLQEDLEELNEIGDYGELLEEMFDFVKDELYEEN